MRPIAKQNKTKKPSLYELESALLYLYDISNRVDEGRQSSTSLKGLCLNIQVLISNFNGWNIKPNSV